MSILSRLLNASDLMQSYVDLIADRVEDLSDEEKTALLKEVEQHQPDGIEEAGAKAMLLSFLNPLASKIIRLNSEGDDDGKLYRIPAQVWEQIKTITTPEDEEWPDAVNEILDEHLTPENEIKPDGDIVTVGDCYGCFEGDKQHWGR